MDQSSYINTVSEVVDQLLTDAPKVKAALLGANLKDRDLDWADYGFARLKDVLIALSASSRISYGPDEKDALSVWRSNTCASAVGGTRTQPWSIKSLKKPVWTAFVSESTPPPRAIDRLTGAVWLSTSEAPREDGEWLTVDPIPRDRQIDWARAFVDSKSLNNEDGLLRSLQLDSWFREFPDRLEAVNSDLRRSWNRERTDRVGEWVIDWCQKHSVPPRLLFDDRKPPARGNTRSPGGQLRLREALLAAVQDLSTEQLLELRLPAGAIVMALRPDLLR
jgi:hypothetical protein